MHFLCGWGGSVFCERGHEFCERRYIHEFCKGEPASSL